MATSNASCNTVNNYSRNILLYSFFLSCQVPGCKVGLVPNLCMCDLSDLSTFTVLGGLYKSICLLRYSVLLLFRVARGPWFDCSRVM